MRRWFFRLDGNHYEAVAWVVRDEATSPEHFRREFPKSRLPKELVIAVTGHRDPSSGEQVEQELEEEFRRIKSRSGDCRFTLLTALAEGADQLALTVFRKVFEIGEESRENENGRAEIRVTLPMPEQKYRETFSDKKAQCRFSELYNHLKSPKESDDIVKSNSGAKDGENVTTTAGQQKDFHDEKAQCRSSELYNHLKSPKESDDIVKSNWDAKDGENVTKTEGQQDNRFASLAAHYAEHADVVIAVWDGVWNGKDGGTSHIVEQLRRNATTRQRCRIVRWLSTPRLENPFPVNEAMTWSNLDVDCSPRIFGNTSESSLQRLRSSWKTLTLGLLLLSALGAGGYGYLQRNTHAWDAVHSAVAHIGFNGFGPMVLTDLGPQTQEAVRFWVRLSQTLAILFVIFSAGVVVEAAFKLFSRILLWFRVRRPHDLVIGLGTTGQSILQDSPRTKHLVVANEIQPDPATKQLCSRLGISLRAGDALDSSVLKDLGLALTGNAYVCTGSDDTNMRIVSRIASLRSDHQSRRGSFCTAARGPKKENSAEMLCAVGISDRENLQTLRNCLPPGHGIDLRMFNKEEVTARAFLATHHLDRFSASPESRSAQIILVGDGPLAHALLRQILQEGIFESGKSLEVIRLCARPRSACRAFVDEYPCYEMSGTTSGPWKAEPLPVWETENVLAPVQFHALPHSDVGRIEWFEKQFGDDQEQKPVTTVLVACATSSASAHLTSVIIPLLEQTRIKQSRDIAIWSYFDTNDATMREDLERTLNAGAPTLPVGIISDFLGRCTRQLADGSGLDALAYRINGYYCGLRGKGLYDKAELRKLWRDLSENDRDSNRQAAAHALVKWRILRRLRHDGKSEDEIKEELARCEHRRWCAEYLLKGFRPLTRIPSEHNGFAPNEEEKHEIDRWFGNQEAKASYKDTKRHVDLIPYDDMPKLLSKDLAKQEQGKDRNQISLLQQWLRCETTELAASSRDSSS